MLPSKFVRKIFLPHYSHIATFRTPVVDFAKRMSFVKITYMYHLLYLILRVQCYSPGIDNMSHIACMEMLPVAFFLATDDA